MSYVRIDRQFLLAVRRVHERQGVRGNLYKVVRLAHNTTQQSMARKSGITTANWAKREQLKRKYQLGELLALKQLCKLDWEQFGRLIEACA
jgi:transcriptional regulator with XRE-family HTH domain